MFSKKILLTISVGIMLLAGCATADVTKEINTVSPEKEEVLNTEQPNDKNEYAEQPNDKSEYLEPEEVYINGASDNVVGAADIKEAVQEICRTNGAYLRYIENEADGGLYFEISCENDTKIAREITELIKEKCSETDYANYILIDYSDVSKAEGESNRMILYAEIGVNGDISYY